MNLTLVAFHGEKPDPLAQFIKRYQALVSAAIPTGFRPYGLEQVHATVIGLEGTLKNGSMLNARFLERGQERPMDIRGLLDFVLGTNYLPFRVQLGGFSADEDYLFTSFGRHPYDRSFEVQSTNAVVAIGWPAVNGTFPHTLDNLRRHCNAYNVLHKYHRHEACIDNDFFLVLGRVENEQIDSSDRKAVSSRIRSTLSNSSPVFVDVTRDDLALIAYSDERLPIDTSLRIPFARADRAALIRDVEEIIDRERAKRSRVSHNA